MKAVKKVIDFIKKHKELFETLLIIGAILILSCIIGMQRIVNSNFNPINGDFQNYNPVRRFLAGQIPFKDFAVYLGSGHLILFSIFTLIVGNNFTGSLFASHMLSMIMFSFTTFAISFMLLKNKKQALYLTLGVAIFNYIRPKFITMFLTNDFLSAVNYGVTPGNSARLIRSSIMPILIILIYLGNKWLEKSNRKFITQNRDALKKVGMALLAGGALAWSNDGGIATYISVSFVYFLFLIKEYKKDIKSIIKYTFMYIAISLLSFLAIITIVTRGHIDSWFKFNMGVSSYQKWYYEGANKRNISILNLDVSYYVLIMAFIAVYYMIRIFKSKEKENALRYGLLMIAVLSPLISSFLYQWLSGGTSKEMLFLVLLILIIGYIFKIVYAILEKYKEQNIMRYTKIALVIVTLAALGSNFASQFIALKDRTGVYIEELGGYFTALGDSIKEAMQLVGNEKIFSTYASAVEVATNQYQPTGDDYIIHCMGDEQREEYLEVFRKGEFKYAVTMDNNYTGWRYWIRNSNWFFHRELYKDYRPKFATEYNVFWEKSNENNVVNLEVGKDVNIEVTKKDEKTARITIKTEDKNFDGIADVKLAYTSAFKESFFKKPHINRYVNVVDVTTQEIANDEWKVVFYNLPTSSEEYYVPITIMDGVGEIEITTYPLTNTLLNINSAEIVDVLDVNFKYCIASRNKKIENNTIFVDDNAEMRTMLRGAKAIKINDIETKVVDYKEHIKDDKNGLYLTVKVEDNAEAFAYPYYFEVIK